VKNLLASILSVFFLFSCTEGGNPARTAERYRVDTHGVKTSDEVNIADLTRAYVTRVSDGDTMVVDMEDPPEGLEPGERIRFLGVDTPETVHPNKEVQQFGKEASDYTKAELTHQTVYLAFDWDLRDRYDRVLAYVYTGDNLCFNAELIKRGYARAYTYFPFQFEDEFVELERLAKETQTGLWQFE
jgi:micrococcal nuclease